MLHFGVDVGIEGSAGMRRCLDIAGVEGVVGMLCSLNIVNVAIICTTSSRLLLLSLKSRGGYFLVGLCCFSRTAFRPRLALYSMENTIMPEEDVSAPKLVRSESSCV